MARKRSLWNRALPLTLMATGIGVFALSVLTRKRAVAVAQPTEPPPYSEPGIDTPALNSDAQYVHEQLMLAAAATDQGACLSANEALVNALRAMENFSGPELDQMEERLKSILLRRYADQNGLCQ